MSKKKINKNNSKNTNQNINSNSLQSFTQNIISGGSPQNMQLETMIRGIRFGYITQLRDVLSNAYIQHGLIQKLIGQPVDDAFKGGVKVKTKLLDDKDIKKLYYYCDRNNIVEKIKQTIKWSRLYGGSGLVINASQKTDEPFDINKINEKSKLEFYPADCWELNMQYYSQNPSVELLEDIPYNFYGQRLHKSRVLTFKGKEAPSFFRRQFRNWGMSEVERLVSSFNQFLKNNEIAFELMDECKVDVYKIEGYKDAFMTGNEESIRKQIELSNQLKNFLNSLVMDKNDDFQTKAMSFSGVAEMMKENRMLLASDLNMPITKLFGISASGFNAGDDDIENYNAMLESEIRSKAYSLLTDTYRILIKHLFDVVVDDLQVEFEPLRILTAEQEEIVKTQKLDRLLRILDAGLIDTQTAKECLNMDNLIAKDIDVNSTLFKEMVISGQNEGF